VRVTKEWRKRYIVRRIGKEWEGLGKVENF